MEYMEVLGKIIEAERAAQQIAGAAKALRDNLPHDLRSGWEETRQKYMARAEHRVQVIREDEEARAGQQIAQLETELLEDLQKLYAHFDAHHDEMADRLFRLVIDV